LLENSSRLAQTGGYVHHLKQAIKNRASKSGCSKGVLYRGMRIPKDQTFLYEFVGRRFVWPNFVSSSHLESVARNFALKRNSSGEHDTVKALFIIDTNGTGCTYVVDIEDVTVYQGEQEALFYPYSAFVITEAYRESSGTLVVKVRTYDSKLYFASYLQKFEECRFAYPIGERRVPISQCFYEVDGKKYSAISSAYLPEFGSCASRWCGRSSATDLAKQIEKYWKDKINVLFLGSGSNQLSVMAVGGFGTSQAYKYGSNLDEIKAWIQTYWDKKESWAITSWGLNADTYFVIMTKDPSGMCSSCTQLWRTRSSWSEIVEEMNEGYKKGYIITEASFSEAKHQYVLVMTKSSKKQSQKSAKAFPKEWVQGEWKKGKTITKVMHNRDKDYPDCPWFVVATSDMGTCNSWSTGLGAD
jgi:hypothetical protein